MMKKIICMMTALLICFSMVVPVCAAENSFVPSIPYKDCPDLEDAIMGGIDVSNCIVITSIRAAIDKLTDITQEERDLLLKLYEELANGTIKLPIEEDYVIRDLVDINFKHEECRSEEEHNQKDQQLAQSDISIEMTFDLGSDKYVDPIVMAYNDGTWEPIASVTNNGDGTVTCVFDHFCAVAFAVKQSQYEENPQTDDAISQNLMLWTGVFVASLVVLAAVVVVYIKKRKFA